MVDPLICPPLELSGLSSFPEYFIAMYSQVAGVTKASDPFMNLNPPEYYLETV
jgi:hypothetical protein